MRADLKQKPVLPAHIVSTQLRPDVVLWSNLVKVAYFVKLTVPWEDRVKEAYKLKKNTQRCWKKLHSEAGVLD